MESTFCGASCQQTQMPGGLNRFCDNVAWKGKVLRQHAAISWLHNMLQPAREGLPAVASILWQGVCDVELGDKVIESESITLTRSSARCETGGLEARSSARYQGYLWVLPKRTPVTHHSLLNQSYQRHRLRTGVPCCWSRPWATRDACHREVILM